MRRLIAAAVLFSLVVLIVWSGHAVTEHYHDDYQSRLDSCEKLYREGNKKSAAVLAADIKTDFEKTHLRLSAFVNRETVDEAVLSVSRLESYAKSGDDSLFYSECEVVRAMLHHMLENEQFSLLSIF
ncbi:MAG: DUF4363 family protein [Clostridia bacterium]|nr:DUF4363 family protein [Clostridia bacterium]